ncbi:ABC transporter ATP-binding protein [Acuticoccus sp. MNP-M23]|uniref:ABC transporter ATP-binding protein n=1 Tax=Acuticoccus sp. MNP-M23 TaxID=3072793 RepID=UPI0028151AEE|nr:ABC transporter ATP-binding protein [Acuticoccus sp. MNP-M23]WMS44008.1 ABC transporter ATP-binding protein [Acuticoccus sp. MNP-M23]
MLQRGDPAALPIAGNAPAQTAGFMSEQKFSLQGLRRGTDRGHVVIDNVSISFETRGSTVEAVRNASTEVRPGEFVCLLGPSGSGKSTLLNAVAGFVTPTSGRITVDGAPIMGPGPDRGMVFQQYSLFPWKTVLQNIAFGPRMTGRGGERPESVARNFLEMIGLSKFADRYPRELSGGMQQRVGIARALANYPSVLLMDEPFGALDSQTRVMMQESLLDIWREFGTTVLFVTHDVDEAVYLADRVIVLSAGPGEIIADIPIPLPRPRTSATISGAEFVHLRQQCLDLIRVESLKAFERQKA